MAQLVKVNIELEGGRKIEGCRSFTLRQDLFRHHSFEVEVPMESIEGKEEAFFKTAHKEVCGKAVSFTLEPVLEKRSFGFRFKGIITEILLVNIDELSNVYVLKGYGPTILLEDIECRRAFTGKDLKQIFETLLDPYPGNMLRKKLHPRHSAAIQYTVQYDESNFEFLGRLAAGYGEWWYYDGLEMMLGDPVDGKEIGFEAGGSQRYDMSIGLAPARFKLLGYDYSRDRTYNSAAASRPVEGLGGFGRFALETSEHLFNQDAQLMAERAVFSQEELDDLAAQRRAGIAGKLVIFEGRGDNPEIMIGKVISSSGTRPGSGGGRSRESFGKFRVTEIMHSVDLNGNYSNIFKAVPASAKIPPVNPYIRIPMGSPELAKIIDINDPYKMNRVRVEFHWPMADRQSDWIRVGTFYSGSDQGGMQFLPEKDAQVVVGYELNKPDMPFVLTSLYPKKDGMHGVKGNNDQKLIYTRGGNMVELTDKKDDCCIRITNKAKDDTSIQLEFKDDGKIVLATQGNIEISAGIALTLSADQQITLESQNIELKGQWGKMAMTSDGNVEITGNTKAKLTSPDMEVNGDITTTIKGGVVKIN